MYIGLVALYWILSCVAIYANRKRSKNGTPEGKTPIWKHIVIILLSPLALPIIAILLFYKKCKGMYYKNRPKPVPKGIRKYLKKDLVIDENNKTVSLVEYNYKHGTSYGLDDVYGKKCFASFFKYVILKSYNKFKRLFTWKGRISRCEFIVTFVLAILLIYVFSDLAFNMFYEHYPFNNLRFNIAMGIHFPLVVLGFVFGVIPLLLVNLFCLNQMVIQSRGLYDMDFLPLMIVVDILFVLYLFQCFKRCHDLGKSGLYCLIPIWNPIALLFCRGDKGENEYDLEKNPKTKKKE